jgi:hypothetical protein
VSGLAWGAALRNSGPRDLPIDCRSAYKAKGGLRGPPLQDQQLALVQITPSKGFFSRLISFQVPANETTCVISYHWFHVLCSCVDQWILWLTSFCCTGTDKLKRCSICYIDCCRCRRRVAAPAPAVTVPFSSPPPPSPLPPGWRQQRQRHRSRRRRALHSLFNARHESPTCSKTVRRARSHCGG